jgi:hypothetical protein
MLDTTAILLSTAAMFVIGFVLLFLIYYFTSPLYTEYGNPRSRLIYSLVNSLYFSLVLAIMFAVLPTLSDIYGVMPSLAVGVVIILISTIVQVLAISTLVRRGIIRMKRKIRR